MSDGKPTIHADKDSTRSQNYTLPRYVTGSVPDSPEPGRILEGEPLSVTATKKSIRRMTLQLCYFRSRGYIFCLPLLTTAA